MWANRPLPDWFQIHHDARILGVPVYPAKSAREVPYYIRLQARAYHEALRAAGIRVARKNEYVGVIAPSF